MKNNADRRQHKRYPVKSGSYAVLQPYYDIMGPVINISRGGLAFYYYPMESVPSDGLADLKEIIELSIISDTDNFFVEGISTIIISDSESSEFHQHYELNMRRCSLRFEALDKSQQEKLDQLISLIKKQCCL